MDSTEVDHRKIVEKVEIIQLYYAHGLNCETVRRRLYLKGLTEGKWSSKTPMVRCVGLPSNEAIRKVIKVFTETGSVSKRIMKTCARKKTIRTAEILAMVREEVLRSPETSKSHSRISKILHLHPSTIYLILKDLKLKPYIPRRRQALNDGDWDKRMEFCETWLSLMERDTSFYEKVIWSDEAKFHLCGNVNRHNCVYWSECAPDISAEETVNSPGVMVWCGMSSKTIIGPIFLEGCVTGITYLTKVLTETVFPYLTDNDDEESLVFQQDGAPAHYANVVRNALNEKLAGRWIGRRGSIEWPARSPDLSPLDFFLWGYLKNKVYGNKLHNLGELKSVITNEIEKLKSDPDLLKRVCSSVTARVNECMEANGGHFEYRR